MADTKLITIAASERTQSGKTYARKLRKNGQIPGVLLEKGKTTAIEFSPKDLNKAWKTEGHKFLLKLGETTKTVEIKELQLHPVKRWPLHADLAVT